MRLLLAAFLALALRSSYAGIFSSKKVARVQVDSMATAAYQNRKEDAKPETFHVYQGRYFGGAIVDKSLDRVSFQEMVDTLAKDMAKKNYFPENDPMKGDLLIVVHWGVTSVEEDWADLMGITSYEEFSDSSAEDDSTYDTSDSDFIHNPASQNSAAKLIGYDRALRKKGLTEDERNELRTDLKEERYFIIMMAYDYQLLLAEKKLEFLWSTRFSLRSIGTNFEEAYQALSRGATPYFGENLDGLTKSTTHLGKGEVDFGELEIIEDVVDKNDSKK